MAVHLIRLAAGVETIEDLRKRQLQRMKQARRKSIKTYTRNVPKRSEELIEGGSIYWVIKSLVRVRQKITGFERQTDEKGRGYCLIGLDKELVLVEPRTHKAFQGWRYLRAEDAPPDLRGGVDHGAKLPDALAAELRALGLL
jgi:hypothetical protein